LSSSFLEVVAQFHMCRLLLIVLYGMADAIEV